MTETTAGPLPVEATIHQRMVRILAELPAIGRGQYNEQQKFKFRGYDDMMNALNPLLGEHGVYIVPNVVERITGERSTRSGSTMYEVNLHIQFRFYGLAGDYVEASGWGEGTDMGDKATNKATTAAIKYVLDKVYAISTEEASDADSGTPEETTRGVTPAGPAPFPQPTSWPKVKAAIVEGYGAGDQVYAEFEQYLAAAAAHLFGESSLRKLATEQRGVMLQKASGAAVWLRENADDEVRGPTAEDMQQAWAAVLEGTMLTVDVPSAVPDADAEAIPFGDEGAAGS